MGTYTLFAMDRPECAAGLEGPSVLPERKELISTLILSASNKSE